jgi:hypothetical protein
MRLFSIKLSGHKRTPIMKRNAKNIPHEPAEAEIQHAAYLLWVQNGRPEGHELEHWLAAKELLCHRRAKNLKSSRPRVQDAPKTNATSDGKN